MEVIYFLLPVAIVMSATGLGFFVWALRGGQFDDLEGPRWRVIFDDETLCVPPSDVSSGGLVPRDGGLR